MDDTSTQPTSETSGSEPQQSEQTPSAQAPPKSYPRSKARIKMPEPKFIAAAAALLVMLAVIVIFAPKLGGLFKPTTTVSTTVQQINLTKLSSCTTISKPGTYYFTSDVNTSIQSGACLKITSNNVKISGNGHTIGGNGPYAGVPPFSYGISLQGVSNVTVQNLQVSKFSYDIYLNNTKQSTIEFSNFTKATLADIYFVNSSNNTVMQDFVSQSQSSQGGIYLKSGGSNKFINNTVVHNAYYGIKINSTGNRFTQETFANNPADLVCNATSAFKRTNSFNSSKCAINDYCEFASCSTNVPFNLTSLKLVPGNIFTCGAIFTPGNYSLAKSISASAFVNVSNPLAKGACIQILAPNVNFNCRGNQINGSAYGIYTSSATNANITNCNLYKNKYGIYFSSTFNPRVFNSTMSNNTYGIYLTNVTSGKLSNTILVNNTYGVFLNSTQGLLVNKINAYSNTYGVFTYSAGSVVFNGGSAFNNTKNDFYCSGISYNSTTDLAQGFSCGVTDCNWASTSCKQTVAPSLASYAVNNCGSITHSGNFTLRQNIIAQGSCFKIQASNVIFNCNYHTMAGVSTGNAFALSNVANVSIVNCNMVNFGTGVNVTNTKQLVLGSVTIRNVSQGVILANVSGSVLSNVNVYISAVSGFSFTKLSSSTIANDSATNGSSTSSGFVFANSTRDQIVFDQANSNPIYGFKFMNSFNNSIHNNTALNNVAQDYVCAGSSVGLYSNPIATNYGITKSACNWMVEISTLIPGPACTSILAPTQLVFNRDLLFNLGSTCFGIYTEANNNVTANGTTINCNGHIVYSTVGGTFVNIQNATNVKISNCIILNFSTAVQSNSIYTSVYNNTISNTGNAILLTGGRYASIYRNLINNGTNGIIAYNTGSASVYNNRFNNTKLVGIALFNSTSGSIINNTASGNKVGLYFQDTNLTSIKNNQLLGSSLSGIECVGASTNSSSKNFDYGGNICSKNTACRWVTASPSCKSS